MVLMKQYRQVILIAFTGLLFMWAGSGCGDGTPTLPAVTCKDWVQVQPNPGAQCYWGCSRCQQECEVDGKKCFAVWDCGTRYGTCN